MATTYMAPLRSYARPARPVVATAPVTVYGTRWCGITQMVRRLLDRAGVDYRYVDLDLHPEMERRLRWMAGGDLRTPVVDIGGQWLEQPTFRELQWALSRSGLL